VRLFAGLLAKDLGARTVVVGHDLSGFGRNGEATAPMLADVGRRLGFAVDVVPPVTFETVSGVSSSGGAPTRLWRGDFCAGQVAGSVARIRCEVG